MQGKKTLAGQVNTKTASITDFKIDKEGPWMESVKLTKEDGTTYEPGTWTNQDVILTYEAYDSGVGMDKNIFTETFSQEGANVYAVNQQDKLGNYGLGASYDIRIDKTEPYVEARISRKKADLQFELSGYAYDVVSGFASEIKVVFKTKGRISCWENNIRVYKNFGGLDRTLDESGKQINFSSIATVPSDITRYSWDVQVLTAEDQAGNIGTYTILSKGTTNW